MHELNSLITLLTLSMRGTLYFSRLPHQGTVHYFLEKKSEPSVSKKVVLTNNN